MLQKTSYQFFFLFFLASSIAAAQQPQTAMPNYPVPTVKSVKLKELSTGARDITFKQDDGSLWKSRISIPKIEEGEKVPLIIALHWAGRGDTYQEYARCLAEPGLENLKGIIISPSAGDQYWWAPSNEARILRLVKLAKKHWPIDENKIIVTGYSNGAIGSWFFAREYPKVFSAAIPIAGSYQQISSMRIPLYVIHGELDSLFHLKDAKIQIAQSIAKGSDIICIVAKDLSHYMGCAYVPYLKEAAKWVISGQ